MSNTIQQWLIEAPQKAAAWTKANPVRFVPRWGANFCFMTAMVPSKEDPEVYVEAYEVPLWTPKEKVDLKEKADH
ncbi:hypothetical protein [Chitinophaga caseinilytica]|uniref:Uncharacterized protein n=1 Tax=Chitinophaga caseinilytica TaxID=2267521 RepID=A0ABZ2ZBZ9_9BACT